MESTKRPPGRSTPRTRVAPPTGSGRKNSTNDGDRRRPSRRRAPAGGRRRRATPSRAAGRRRRALVRATMPGARSTPCTSPLGADRLRRRVQRSTAPGAEVEHVVAGPQVGARHERGGQRGEEVDARPRRRCRTRGGRARRSAPSAGGRGRSWAHSPAPSSVKATAPGGARWQHRARAAPRRATSTPSTATCAGSSTCCARRTWPRRSPTARVDARATSAGTSPRCTLGVRHRHDGVARRPGRDHRRRPGAGRCLPRPGEPPARRPAHHRSGDAGVDRSDRRRGSRRSGYAARRTRRRCTSATRGARSASTPRWAPPSPPTASTRWSRCFFPRQVRLERIPPLAQGVRRGAHRRARGGVHPGGRRHRPRGADRRHGARGRPTTCSLALTGTAAASSASRSTGDGVAVLAAFATALTARRSPGTEDTLGVVPERRGQLVLVDSCALGHHAHGERHEVRRVGPAAVRRRA